MIDGRMNLGYGTPAWPANGKKTGLIGYSKRYREKMEEQKGRYDDLQTGYKSRNVYSGAWRRF